MAKVLAAFGVHDGAEPTLRWATGFSARAGHELIVVHAIQTVASEVDPELWNEIDAHQRADITSSVGRLTDDPFTVELLHGETHAALTTRAAADDIDYVVTGKHGMGGSGGFGGRGTAMHLLHHSSKPTIVVEGSGRLGDGPVVVGVDGSGANAAALEVADAVAAGLGSTVVCVLCIDSHADSFVHPDGWQSPAEEAVREEMASTVGTRQLLIETGHPTSTLARVASEQHASVLAVGTRGSGGFAGLRLGRVPVQLLDHSPCPLLVVPH